MIRLLLVLALAAVCLALLVAIAPYLFVVALAILILAWRKPAAVEKVTSSRRLAPVPETVRSTPMRFAASLVAVTFTLTAASAAFAGNRSSQAEDPTPEPEVAREVQPAATPPPVPTSEPTAKAPAEPTAPATPKPEPTPEFGTEPTGQTQIGTVVEVIDGDTIDVDIDGTLHRVRYIGMDTPETRSGYEWMGAEAAAANAALVAGREVVLEKDVSETDRYDRLLRYVWVEDGSGWLLINLELIRLGYAAVATYPPDVKYIDGLYLTAQQQAQNDGIGLWGATPTPVPTPTPQPTPIPTPTPQPITPLVPQSNCHASYIGFCLTVGIGDWDCASGSGDGPNYVPVTVQVVAYDEYGLDREGDGLGCE